MNVKCFQKWEFGVGAWLHQRPEISWRSAWPPRRSLGRVWDASVTQGSRSYSKEQQVVKVC
jgi:hypothetical protein